MCAVLGRLGSSSAWHIRVFASRCLYIYARMWYNDYKYGIPNGGLSCNGKLKDLPRCCVHL